MIWNIGKIRHFLTRDAAERLVHAFISSCLDNLNSLLTGVPDYLIHRLQLIQNTAARIITRTKQREHITPVLHSLHWLPIKQRIDYKIALLTFNCLHGLAPQYLIELIELYVPTRTLRSSSECMLVERSARTVRYGQRSFSYYAPKLWNRLPKQIRDCDNKNDFKGLLKTFLFTEAYSS